MERGLKERPQSGTERKVECYSGSNLLDVFQACITSTRRAFDREEIRVECGGHKKQMRIFIEEARWEQEGVQCEVK